MTAWSARAIALAGVLAGSWSTSSAGAAEPGAVDLEAFEPPVDPPRSAVRGLVIWIEPLVPEADQLRGWIEERAQQVLDEGRSLEAVEVIHLAVRGAPYNYEVYFGLVRNKRLIEGQLEPLMCPCGSDEMLDKVGAAIVEGAERLAKAAEAERNEAVARRNQAYLAAEERAEQERQEAANKRAKHRRIGAIGFSGIAVGVVGAGVLAGGIPLAARPEDFERADQYGGTRSVEGVGIGMAVVGSLVLGGGVAMLLLDLARRGERRVVGGPTGGAGRAGVLVGGWF